MTKLKAFLRKFSRAEIVIVTIGLLLSLTLVSVAYGYESKYGHKLPNYKVVQATAEIKDTKYVAGGEKIFPFHTPFYVAYDFSGASEQVVRPQIESILNEYLISYHKLFDRHRLYYVNHDAPETERKLLHNLKYINDHLNEEVEIAAPLYELLEHALNFTLNAPNGAFNLFIGELYDFWQPRVDVSKNVSKDPHNSSQSYDALMDIVANIPQTAAEIMATLKLRRSGDKYYAQLNKFNDNVVSISVGALGKGYMTDILKQLLQQNNFTNGYIFGGASSLTFLSDAMAEKTPVRLPSVKHESSPPYDRDMGTSYAFTRRDAFSISTSGTYDGYRFKDSEDNLIIRSHIINPTTGFPAQQGHELVSVVSNKLSGLELDYLTTVLIVLSEADGIAFLANNYANRDVNVFYLGSNSENYYAHFTRQFPGGKNSILDQISQYREKFLDLL